MLDVYRALERLHLNAWRGLWAKKKVVLLKKDNLCLLFIGMGACFFLALAIVMLTSFLSGALVRRFFFPSLITTAMSLRQHDFHYCSGFFVCL